MNQKEPEKLPGEELDQEVSSPVESSFDDERRIKAKRERRYLIIGTSVVALFVVVIIVALWKWRSSSDCRPGFSGRHHLPARASDGGRKNKCADQANGAVKE